MKKLLFLLFLFFLSSCYSGDDDDPQMRTVPVTNNPNIVPNHGSGLPGIPSFPR